MLNMGIKLTLLSFVFACSFWPSLFAHADATSLEADTLQSLKEKYALSLKAVIDSRCQTCHAQNLGEVNFGTFELVKTYSGRMADVTNSGRMPLGAKLPETEKLDLVNFFNTLSSLPN